MVRYGIKHVMCVILASSSISMWGMEEAPRTYRSNSQGFRFASINRAIEINSEGASPVSGCKSIKRRNSAPDSPRSLDLRKTLAALILNPENSSNERVTIPSPSGNAIPGYSYTPRSSDGNSPNSGPKTPNTPGTPVTPTYTLPGVKKIVVESALPTRPVAAGVVMERVRAFPRDTFNSNWQGDVWEYGTMHLKVDRNTKTCVLEHVELHPSIESDLHDSMLKDLQARGNILAAERQKEMQ